MQTFKNFIKESRGDKVVFTFGRFNPPTTGHELLINKLVGASKGGYTPMVFTSHSNDIKKNPLTHKQKVFYLNRFFGNRVTVANSPARHIFDIAVFLYEQGFRDVRMVVGSDRVKEFEMLLNKYNGKDARHGFYRFDNIQIISAGERDPDADDVTGMSASKMRQFVKDNDFAGFAQGVPSTGKKLANRMFSDLQRAMKVRPQQDVSVMDEEIDERVMDRAERRKRGLAMKRNAKKIAIAKKRNAKKKASQGNLQKRAEKQAINKLRAKFAGDKGGSYANLSTADKMAVDKKIEKKRSVIPKLAKKLMPQIKKAEQQRLDKARGKTNESFLLWNEEVSRKQISDLEKFADRLLNKFDIDVEFTRHFADRMNDDRNKPEIKVTELQRLFKKIAKNKGTNLKKHGDAEAVLKDMQSDLNLPVVINYKNGEFEVVNKTIMRKKNFKTSNPVVQYEEVEDLEEKAFRTWAQSFARLKSKTISKDKYEKIAKYVKQVMDKDTGKRAPESYASDIIRKFNLTGIDVHSVVDTMKDLGLVKEEKDDNTRTKQDPDIKDKDGTQPARYHSGLDKKTKEKRDAHFKRGAKKDDDDPSAYKPAPGDKGTKTKPSKYTKEFKKMFGEQCWDGYKQQGMKKKGDRMVPNCIPEEQFFEDTVVEDADAALKKKAEKSGESLAVLKKVYKRGVAAWRTGHRPGTTPEQWGHARVNAFIVKKKKGKLNHDQDLA